MDNSESKITGLISPLTNLNDRGIPSIPVKKNRSKKACFYDPPEIGWKLFTNSLEIGLPIKTISEANCFEPWHKRHKRHKKQKNTLFWTVMQCRNYIKLPCTITYIRYAPGLLDKHDNLPMSMKYLNDQLCAEITGDHRPGRADDSKEITIKYDQLKCKQYSVKIIIEF